MKHFLTSELIVDLKKFFDLSAWYQCWFFYCGKGSCKPCCWISKQSCHWNGVSCPGKRSCPLLHLKHIWLGLCKALILTIASNFNEYDKAYRVSSWNAYWPIECLSSQANTPEELPEYLLATCRLNHLDISKAVLVKPWSCISSQFVFCFLHFI